MVVDDDPKILFAFQEVLRTEGYRSVTAKDGEDALDKIASKNPNVIFLDVTMPKLDGLELLKRMKENKELAPVIIITGYGTMQTAINAIDGYQPTAGDQADFDRHQAQLIGQFLIDRDGVVRWVNIERVPAEFPSEAEFLAAARSVAVA